MMAMTIRSFSLEHPIAAVLALLLIAGLFRVVDIFVLRLDERWGEIILSKIVGVVLVLGFLALTGAGLSAGGFHSRAAVPSVLLGAGLTVAAMFLGYVADFVTQAQHGAHPAIQIAPIDPKSGLAGATAFGLLLVVGNLVNSFAEEGLFRGVQIPLLMREIAPWLALAFSALLFGLWHLPWALKAITASQSASVSLSGAIVANFVPQALLGLVWAYLYLRTGNLWGSFAAHTLTNSAVNFVHIRSSEGMDTGIPLRMATFTIVMILGMAVIWYVSKRYELSEVQPWGTT
jgi:membrane protease YdiL (CAAX protease family)